MTIHSGTSQETSSETRTSVEAIPPGLAATIIKRSSQGVLLGAILAMAVVGMQQRLTTILVIDAVIGGFLGFLFIAAFDGIFSLLKGIIGQVLRLLRVDRVQAWWARVPLNYLGQLVGAFVFIFGRAMFPDSILKSATVPAPGGMVMIALALGGVLMALAERQSARHNRSAYVLYAAALLPLVVIVGWLAWPGSSASVLTPAEPAPVAPLTLDNPGQPGAYTVEYLTYGSGTDRLRPEYGPDVTLVTNTVDGSPIYAGFSGPSGQYTQSLWGFDNSKLPLNGRVWYPAGDGPFPLVMVVHGNHAATEFSDPGYAYLGELLASRGFITVSVDENFLNGWMFDDGGGNEMPLRSWMLLKHLNVWRDWNADPANPFFEHVDMDRIALIGHSRGGEAVALAADMNERLYPPVNKVSQYGEFDFGIKAVVAIAPSDAMYRPRGDLLTLRDVSYLTLDGAHDADTDDFFGLAQYSRTDFSGRAPEAFKAVAYLYRANHGQFNSVWNYGDNSSYNWMLLNRAALLTEDNQQAATQTVIGAFLEAVLHEEADYRTLFTTPDAARDWLPEDILVTQYQDATFIPVDSNTGPNRPETIEAEGGLASGSDLSTWKVEMLYLRNANHAQNNAALHVGWEAGTTPAVRYDLLADANPDWSLSADDALTLQLVGADDTYQPADVTVTLDSANGTSAAVPLNSVGTLHPPLVSYQYKSPTLARLFGLDLGWVWDAERVLQVYDLPLAAFLTAAPELDLDALTGITIAFDGSRPGDVYLDEIGFRQQLSN